MRTKKIFFLIVTVATLIGVTTYYNDFKGAIDGPTLSRNQTNASISKINQDLSRFDVKSAGDALTNSIPSLTDVTPVERVRGKNIGLKIDYLLSLNEQKKNQELLEELNSEQYSDASFIESVFEEYLNSEIEEDKEKLWMFMTMLRSDAVAATLSNAIDSSTGEELLGWLLVLPNTAAFSNPSIRESVISILNESDKKDLLVASLDALNPELSVEIDKSMITSVIGKHVTSLDPEVRIAAYRQQAKWFEPEQVKAGLTDALSDADNDVVISAMSILEESGIKDDTFKEKLKGILLDSEKGSDLYNYSADTLVHYFGYTGEQLADITGHSMTKIN